MHELSIATSLVELVDEHATREAADHVQAIHVQAIHVQAIHVQAIHVRLGELSGFRRALYFCFDRVSRGTICEGARLVIEDVPLTVHCDHCDATKKPGARYNFRCPTCGMPTPTVVTGREMQVTAIELGFNDTQTGVAARPDGLANTQIAG